jgi:hypothetical protein
MIIRDAKQSDLDYLYEHSVSRGQKEPMEQIDFLYTMEEDGDVFAIGGFRMLTKNTAWCFVNWSDMTEGRKKDAYRHTRAFLEHQAKALGFRRIMAAVRANFPEAINMIEHLGFERECLMKSFFEDDDAYLYASMV